MIRTDSNKRIDLSQNVSYKLDLPVHFINLVHESHVTVYYTRIAETNGKIVRVFTLANEKTRLFYGYLYTRKKF